MSSVSRIDDYRDKPLPVEKPGGLNSGDGSGTFDRMEARVAVLEAGMKRIESTLDRIDTKLDRLSSDVSEIKGALPSLATNASVVAVETALKDKPGTWQAVLISLLISGLAIAAALGGAAKFLPK